MCNSLIQFGIAAPGRCTFRLCVPGRRFVTSGQFVKVLGAVLDHGLAAVEAACAEAVEARLASGDVILTVLARRRQPEMPASITTPAALRLKIEPSADCGRYDSIRKVA